MKDHIIQGSPTKSFFIEMITRDIAIKDVIIHLLDNSIDGANRINPTNYEGLWVKITINKEEFIVQDNCGGFSLETAQKYAFRFGRPDDAPETKGSVGRFGIGMKRSLFKMGKNFEVESKTDTDHFEVKVDVAEWKSKKKPIKIEDDNEILVEDWDFSCANMTEGTPNLIENGTYIKVTNLLEDVADEFNDIFLNDLANEIEKTFHFSLEKKIQIILNKKALKSKNVKIITDKSTPYFYEDVKDDVKFRIIAGLGPIGNPKESGWYIYCNDRLIVEADQTEMTGWKSSPIPQWHGDFVMFRGILFLDSDFTKKLPLTTTKKGIDTTSEVYKAILVHMKDAMLNIFPFLRQVAQLGNEANEYRETLIEQSESISVLDMKAEQIASTPKVFVPPSIDIDKIAKKKESVKVSYVANVALLKKAMIVADTKSYKEFGRYTFDYFIKMEAIEDE